MNGKVWIIVVWLAGLASGCLAGDGEVSCSGVASVFNKHRDYLDLRIDTISRCALPTPPLPGEITRVFYRRGAIADALNRRYLAPGAAPLAEQSIGYRFEFEVSIVHSQGGVDESWAVVTR